MPLAPSFEQDDHDIIVADDERARAAHRAVRNTWSSKTREAVTTIEPTDDWDGDVYAVQFDDSRKPPTLGSDIRGLARHGWGVLWFDQHTLFIARIIPSEDDDKAFVFEGREDVSFDLPLIRQPPTISLDEELPLNNEASLRDERRIDELRDVVRRYWPDETLASVRTITYSTSDYNSYIIKTESDNELEKDDEGNVTSVERNYPNNPLGKHADTLLHEGWVVGTMKSASLFVSRLKPTDPVGDAEYGYTFEGSEDAPLVYVPKRCEFCEDHEYYSYLVVDTREAEFGEMEMPVNARACRDCIEQNDEYPTAEEYREENAEEPTS